jgi:hypothetical protein
MGWSRVEGCCVEKTGENVQVNGFGELWERWMMQRREEVLVFGEGVERRDRASWRGMRC